MTGEDPEAAYFPSIKKKYGKPIEHWIELIHHKTGISRHSDLVSWLKREHGIGHGHATALVGHALRHH